MSNAIEGVTAVHQATGVDPASGWITTADLAQAPVPDTTRKLPSVETMDLILRFARPASETDGK